MYGYTNHNIGIQSYQDLTPPEYFDDAPDTELIRAEIIWQWRDTAIAVMQAASNDPFDEDDISEWALELAAENGDTVQSRIMRQMADGWR